MPFYLKEGVNSDEEKMTYETIGFIFKFEKLDKLTPNSNLPTPNRSKQDAPQLYLTSHGTFPN